MDITTPLSAVMQAANLPASQQADSQANGPVEPYPLENLVTHHGGISVAAPTTQVSLQVWQDAQRYVGYQQNGAGSGSQINLLDDNKNVVDFTSDQSLHYMEISNAQGLADDEKARQVNADLISGKLNPGHDLALFSAGQASGNMKLEYGVAEYSPSMMYRQDEVTYGPRPNDASKGGGIVTNEFNASASLTLPSGNRINLDFSYKEELLVGKPGSISMGALETFEEFEARVEIWRRTKPESESDYRSLAIQYSSGKPLSEEDVKYMDQINQYLMSMAKVAGRGQMNNQSRGLETVLNQVQSLGVDMKMNATYQGYAQGDTEITLSLLGSQSELRVKSEPVLPVNQNPVVDEFW
ncbi:hypothetical protein [Thalassolituus sp. C2-1]|uniref:hypothetical protein n=1 Tax=Venatorbacter sp. C2-1 TaxID=2597518 RepID=UPI0011980A98|nr:hypothetical protein [Thalassolituus sp. C2-1]TVV44379.1 hypothetical protein FOT50_04220 [Thalassolituus sp. C2-1]